MAALFIVTGCSTQRTAMRLHEPADRLALAISPKTPAPAEGVHATSPISLSFMSAQPVQFIVVAAAAPRHRKAWTLLSKVWGQRLAYSSPLDLFCPSPCAISLTETTARKKLPILFES